MEIFGGGGVFFFAGKNSTKGEREKIRGSEKEN